VGERLPIYGDQEEPMARFDDRLLELVRMLRERIPVREWTSPNDSDPGTTIVEVFKYLAEQIATGVSRLPAASRAELARIGTKLADLDRDTGAADVRVNGERWRAVSSFAEQDPDAAVFVLDAERGTVRFGDGVHGKRPPDGAIVAVRYREGAHAGGAEIALTTPWPPALHWSVSPSDAAVSFAAKTPAVASGAGVKRVAYFPGQLLAADDFRAEQEYFRTRLRRLNLAAFGVGVATGLRVSVTDESGVPAITVSPGLAIAPSGDEIDMAQPVSCPIPAEPSAVFVMLRSVERPAGHAPASSGTGAMRPTRIEEGFALAIEPEPDPAAIVLARLLRDESGWRLASDDDD
jgi:hypothetical protein